MKKWIDGDSLLSAISKEGKGAKTVSLRTLSMLITDQSRNQLSDDTFGLILNCAVRYALGRETYVPSSVSDFITPIIPCLSQRTLSVMVQDIEEAEHHSGYGNDTIDIAKLSGKYESRRPVTRDRSKATAFRGTL